MTRLRLIALALVVAGLEGGATPTRPTRPARPGRVPVADSTRDAGGLEFRLSEGQPEAGPEERPPLAPAEPLDDAATKRLLDRLPALEADAADAQDFALREGSLPPPRTGRTVRDPFPPPEAGPAPADGAEAGPLKVLRRQPDGAVPLAPSLSVTFSQPMVSVTSHDELLRTAPPVSLSPEAKGQWRWVGTRTVLFEPDVRFAMATAYRASVAAGTRSATGSSLDREVAWSFSTPPPALVGKHPQGVPARRDTLMFASFDQRIRPQDVIGSIEVKAAGGPAAVRLATPAEIEADESVGNLARFAELDRYLVFRAAEPLPPDSEVKVVVKAGTPSAEGPRRTEKAQEWSFRTYGPLRVTESRCGWQGKCPPFTPWQISFSNPLDAKTFRKSMVSVEPEVPGLRVTAWGQQLTVQGGTRGRTTYRVTLSPEIRDVFGQTLGPSDALTFAVGPAEQSFGWQGGPLVVLDPAAPPRFPVYTVNHASLRVEAYGVTPADWPAFQEFLRGARRRGAPVTPPGQLVTAVTLPIRSAPDEPTETRIDLRPAFASGTGHVVLVAEPTDAPKEEWRRRKLVAWVQATHIGLTAFSDAGELVAWASDLDDGRPLEGVEVELSPGGPKGTTGADGLARLGLDAKAAGLLIARRGRDVALLPQNVSWWSPDNGWRREERPDSVRWYVADDRGLYRPGETARVKGWVRRATAGPHGDVGLLEPRGGGRRVSWKLRDSRNNEIAAGEAPLSALGGFDLALALPPTMNLGEALLQLNLDGEAWAHGLQVQEFRRPEYEVGAKASEGPHFVGGHALVTASALYFAGGALPGAQVGWNVTAESASYTPPNRDDFTFGIWIPWWEKERPETLKGRTETLKGRTDGAGRHLLRIDFDRVEPARPSSLTAEATVTDVNRQAWTATARLLVHPSELYVGLRSGRTFVQQGEPLVVDAIVTDVDGRAVAGRSVSVHSERLDWEQIEGEWKEKPVDPQDCPLVSAGDPVTCRLRPQEGGAYRITATVRDDAGRPNETQLRLWVAGGQTPPRRGIEQERVTLVPGAREYKPGETAEILVLPPFVPAEGVLTLRRAGLLRSERFSVEGASHTLRIPIEEAWTPNVHVQVDLSGATARDAGGESQGQLPKRPAYASGALDLKVPPVTRTLKLEATPRDAKLEPGGSTVVDVSLRDASGRAVEGGEVALIVVDEAVLALTAYKLADPLEAFYPWHEGGVLDYHLRANLLLARPDELAEPEPQPLQAVAYLGVAGGMPAPAAAVRAASAKRMAPEAEEGMDLGATGMGEPEAAPIRARIDFDALALFAASLPTDANGHAQVEVKLPDSLTRYRVMALAVAGGKQFGLGESSITARLPLMVRPSAPRFLNFGDRIELPVVLQNQTDDALSVDVAVRATNATLTAGAGRRVRVPANDRVEVRFPAAADLAGTARFQVGASAGRFADAATFKLPVWTPATTEAFATYGQIDEGALTQPVTAPRDVVPQFGGLEVTTSSTALQALTDAVLYLAAYPFECSEQLASRVLAVAALRDVLAAFKAVGLPKPDELVAAVERDLERLRAMQNDDGSFGFWARGDEPWPYLGVHVAHAFERAKAKGFEVPDDAFERSRNYLRAIEKHIPSRYGPEARRTLIAYALYVRYRMGETDGERARKLLREAGLEGVSFEALGWLLPVLAADRGAASEAESIRALLANRATETAATAHFAVSYGDGAHLILHSDRRADAVLLEALIADQPKSDLVPKLVEGLLGHRKAGRWGNTQENVFVLLALDRYFNTYERTTPDFVARLWLGERYAGEQAFRGRSTDRRHLDVPMRALGAPGSTAPLVLSKEGPGRLYYRIGLRYAPASLKLAPSDHGFTVERAYESMDKKDDVHRDTDGTWHVRAGARVRVKLTMVASSRRYHVALVDPLPAGLEAVNPTRATSGALPEGGDTDVTVMGAPGIGGPGRLGPSWWWWTRPWFEHQNLRDERAEAFSSLLWEGVYTYSYVARATTPGTFVVPPPKAEEMYHPETFGRGATDRVVVE